MESQAEQPVRSEQPIVLREVRPTDPFLRAALIAAAIHLACFFVIDCVTFRDIGPFRNVGTAVLAWVFVCLHIRLMQAPLAAIAGIAVYATRRLVRQHRQAARSV
jgi:hypothetical protein